MKTLAERKKNLIVDDKIKLYYFLKFNAKIMEKYFSLKKQSHLDDLCILCILKAEFKVSIVYLFGLFDKIKIHFNLNLFQDND